MECVIRLPDRWVDAAQLENALRRCGDPHDARFTNVAVHFPPKCKLIIDASIRLLSLLNQLQLCTKAVSLHFLGGDEGVMGYLDRIGFFDHLYPDIVVHPHRPLLSGAIIHRGGNRGLVEIAQINRLGCDEALPGRLAKAVEANCAGRADVKELGGAIFTIFAELVGNIFEHSNTQLDGYAALQTYTKGDKLSVAEALADAVGIAVRRIRRVEPTGQDLVREFRVALIAAAAHADEAPWAGFIGDRALELAIIAPVGEPSQLLLLELLSLCGLEPSLRIALGRAIAMLRLAEGK